MSFLQSYTISQKCIANIDKSNDLHKYSSNQLDVINELLKIYETKNIIELENIHILEVKNFKKFGGIVPIVTMFGGKSKYNEAIGLIKKLLYSKE